MASTIQIRVDDDLKNKSDQLFKDLGTDTTSAIRMFCSLLLNNFYRHDGDRLTTFHYFIVLASELSNARISGFARAFINNSISTSSETIFGSRLFFL